MIKTWQQRMYRSLAVYYNAATLSSEDVFVVCRAPYFGEFRYSVHFSPTVLNWTRFEEFVGEVAGVVGGRGKLTHNQHILQMNVYSNDPQLLRDLHRFRESMQFNSVRIIDQACWHWRLPPPKPKGLYYGKYAYRVRFKDKDWASDPKNLLDLRNVTASWMLSHTRKNFLYCDDVRDVILAKLLFSDEIAETSDRRSRSLNI